MFALPFSCFAGPEGTTNLPALETGTSAAMDKNQQNVPQINPHIVAINDSIIRNLTRVHNLVEALRAPTRHLDPKYTAASSHVQRVLTVHTDRIRARMNASAIVPYTAAAWQP